MEIPKRHRERKKGFTKEDALIQVLEWLDANNQWQLTDLTREEYEELAS